MITSTILDPISETLKIAFSGYEIELEIFYLFPEEQMVGDVIYETFSDDHAYSNITRWTADLIENSEQEFNGSESF